MQALTLALGVMLKQWLSGALFTYLILALWLGGDVLLPGYGPFSVWQTFRDGTIGLSAIAYFAAITLFALGWLRWRWWSPRRALTAWVLLPMVLLLLAFSPLPRWTLERDNDGPLSAEWIHWLQQQHTPVTLTVVSDVREHRDDFRAQLHALTQWHPAVQLDAKHPAELPPDLREQLPSGDGLLIHTLQRHDWMALPQPHLLLGVIVRLQHLTMLSQAWLIFSEGHGERKIFSDDNRDLGHLSRALQQSGYTLAPFDWRSGGIPDNTRVLVLAHVQQPLLPTELSAVLSYLNRGGHLLWLRDPDDAEMPLLEQYLGVHKLPGTVMDSDGLKRGTPHAAIALVDRYSTHSSVATLNALSALPWSAALTVTGNPFNAETILHSSANARLQNNDSLDQIDPSLMPQTYALGVVLERSVKDKAQRIIVVGDSHFAANNAIENYGNQALALHLIRWLAMADDAPPLPDFSAPDAVVLPHVMATLWLAVLFPILLPCIVLCYLALRQWRWRRQA